MKALDRKLWRDLWQMKTQALAIALVVMCGVGTYIMFLTTLHALRTTQASYYRQYRFADVFVSLKRAPESLRQRVQELDGVAQAETRVKAQVQLDIPEFAEPVTALMVSLPDSASDSNHDSLNALHLHAGRLPTPGQLDEVVVSTPFAQAHALQLGARFFANLNGRRQLLTLVGTALSPEFIQQMRPGSAFPDYKRYGVMWMGRRALGQAYDMQGAFNDLALRLSPGADSQTIIDRIDTLLTPYGGLGAYARKDQLSHRFLSQELQQLGTLASLFPLIFMGIAAFLLNVVIGRLVAMQREQVATLKAFGYSNLAVLWHYLKLISVIVGLGVLGGTALGVWLGKALSSIYMTFYHFPYLQFSLQPRTVLEAAVVSFLAAGSGTLFAVWRAASLRPAQAMRPEPPAAYRETWVEKWGLKRWLSPPMSAPPNSAPTQPPAMPIWRKKNCSAYARCARAIMSAPLPKTGPPLRPNAVQPICAPHNLRSTPRATNSTRPALRCTTPPAAATPNRSPYVHPSTDKCSELHTRAKALSAPANRSSKSATRAYLKSR